MPKVTAQEIIDLGFTASMFRLANDTELAAVISSVITEQAAMLEGRLGSSIYDAATTPESTYVKRAERCLVAAEMMSRRITVIAESVLASGDERTARVETAQMKRWEAQAEALIRKLVSGVTTDTGNFATGVTTSTHFADDCDLSGDEIDYCPC